MEGDNIDAQMYRKRLKHLYKKIDSVSSLLWSHENHITDKKRLRSGNSNADKDLDWKNKDTTQIGYGEIAMVIQNNL
jgi:hypothetical protein